MFTVFLDAISDFLDLMHFLLILEPNLLVLIFTQAALASSWVHIVSIGDPVWKLLDYFLFFLGGLLLLQGEVWLDKLFAHGLVIS